jgi:hypothetical protein
MKYPRLYTSLEEFERMELRSGNTDWSIGRFFEEVLDDIGFEDWEDDHEEEDS